MTAKTCPRGTKKVGNRCVSKTKKMKLVDIHINGLVPDMADEIEDYLRGEGLEWTRRKSKRK